MDWAQQNLDKLDEETKEFKTALKEAEEQLFEGIPDQGWDYLKVDGKVIYTRTTSSSPKRVYIEDLKAAHPDIYDKLAKSKPVSKVTRVK